MKRLSRGPSSSRCAWTWAFACALAWSLSCGSARADGGELSLATNYAPTLTLLRSADAPFDAPGITRRFHHVVGVEASYALTHGVAVGVSGQLLWPQALRARDVSWRDAGGQSKTHATVQLHQLQLGGMLLVQVKTDRRQVWDLMLSLGAGVQATRWQASSFSVVRKGSTIEVPDERIFWRVTPAYMVAPAVRWRVGNHIELALGPRLLVSQRGSLALSAAAQLAVPLGIGPAF